MLIPPDRSARLFPSRVLRPPCQLWLAGSTGGEEALTQSDRSMRRPGPVHHLSAHAPWMPDIPFNAACHTGRQPPPSASRVFFFCNNICFFSPYRSPWLTFFSLEEWIVSSDGFIPWETGTETFPLQKQKIRARQKEKGAEVSQKTRVTEAVVLPVGYCGALMLWHRLSPFTFQRQIHHTEGKRLSKIITSVCGNVMQIML